MRFQHVLESLITPLFASIQSIPYLSLGHPIRGTHRCSPRLMTAVRKKPIKFKRTKILLVTAPVLCCALAASRAKVNPRQVAKQPNRENPSIPRYL